MRNRSNLFKSDLGIAIISFLMYLFRIFPINSQKVVFTSFYGKYADNPLAISKKLRELSSDIDIVWLLKDRTDLKSEGIRSVPYHSIRAIYELATAKVWVDSHRKPLWVKKRNSQYYIQTWHGGIAMKKIEGGVDGWPINKIKKSMMDSKMADLFISGCEWRTKNYRDCFWYDGEILKSGQPKADVFYRDFRKLKEQIKKELSVPVSSRIILYAPTFRDDYRTDDYSIDVNRVISSLRHRVPIDWVFLVRLHPILTYRNIDLDSKIINVSDYSDMNKLIIACDVLISDYSSCIFDAYLAKKVVFLFAPDMDRYQEERGFNFKFEDLPSPVAISNQELSNNILYFDYAKYSNAREEFIKKLGYYGNGNASNDVSKIIINKLDIEK